MVLLLFAGCVPPASNAPPPSAPAPNQAYAPPPYGYPQQPQQAQPPYAPPSTPYPQPYPNPQYAARPYAPPPVMTAPAPPPAPPPSPPPRPLLAPLVGTPALRAEISAVIAELVANLGPARAAMVQGVPLKFDASPNDVNAFAGCDAKGEPFIAATEGLLQAIDAIAQTTATDELFGTHTYDAYSNAVAPELVKPHGAGAALPVGIIPPSELLVSQRLSRAHELFDEIAAFTFGHELSHHYLGHTGCAIGSGATAGLDPAALGRILSGLAPGFNQPNEIAADSAGVISVLDTGRARVPNYRWTEHGGLLLLDFFARMERAAGLSPLNPIGFLQTHPNPAFRIPIAQTVARTWWLQHPG
jgi:hypothetical protein